MNNKPYSCVVPLHLPSLAVVLFTVHIETDLPAGRNMVFMLESRNRNGAGSEWGDTEQLEQTKFY
jgi:hypothetical protein